MNYRVHPRILTKLLAMIRFFYSYLPKVACHEQLQ